MKSSAATSAFEAPVPDRDGDLALAVGQLGEQPERVRGHGRRAVGGHEVDELARDGRREHRVARRDEADRSQDLRRRRVLDEEARGAVAQRGEDVVVDVERRQDDDLRRRGRARGRAAARRGRPSAASGCP